VIEWMPRSRGDNGWSHLRDGQHRRRAVLEDIEGGPAIRVPVVVDNWFRAARLASVASVDPGALPSPMYLQRRITDRIAAMA